MLRALAILVGLSSLAHAEDAEGTGYFFVAPQLGFGAPLGLLGIEGGIGFDWFRGAIGAGLGTGGTQIAATARAMTTMSAVDIGLGLGVSKGPGPGHIALGESEEFADEPMFASDTYWTNAEVVVEVPLSRWSFTRFFAGVSYAVDGSCEDANGACDGVQRATLADKRWLPYVGVAAVVRFPEGPARQTFQLPAPIRRY